MAKIRFGYSDDFTGKNNSIGINTANPQKNLEVVGVTKGEGLTVSGISSFTAYEGFLRAKQQIDQDTNLSFDHGPVSSLSGEIIVESGKTVTVNEVVEQTTGIADGTSNWNNLVSGEHPGIISGAKWTEKSFDFDGSNDKISGEICDNLFTNDTDHTIELWVKFDDVTTRQTIISGYITNSDRWDIEVNGGKIKGGHHDAGYFTSTASVVTGVWYHLVLVNDHASSLWRVFINNATDVTASNAGRDLTTPVALGIGDRNDSSIGPLNAQISAVRIYSKELSSAEISTNYNLGPFAKETSVTGNLITHYNANNPSSYPGTVRDIATADFTRAGGSEIECMKVFTSFNPPSGATNDRPYKPKPGELFYNFDLKTIEFYDGYQWRQVEGTSASGRALFSGGYTDGNNRTRDITRINIPTLGNATHFGELARNLTTDGQGVGSQTRGVFCGGYGVQTPGGSTGRQDDIDYVTIASEGKAIDFGNLGIARNGQGSCSSSTRGLIAGGATNIGSPGATNCTNAIEYIEISTLGDGVDFGDLFKERNCSGGIQSSTRGIIGAGDDYHTPAWQFSALGELDYITMASKGNSIIFGSDIERMTGGACSNDVRGIFGGGYLTPQYSGGTPRNQAATAVTFVTISSTGNSLDFGNLTMGFRTYNGAASSKTRGIFTGGSQYPVHFKNIDYVQFATTGDTIDFGDLTVNKGYMMSSTSDSHGGLGGF